ncbi:MAG: DUF4177 domain-containing protein [Pseudopelagicola sp.]|nr:DUF4177 domain-containing protein [Pseudopelagicola sp.]
MSLMVEYEYKVVPAPSRGKRARGVKGSDGRFANAVQEAMNALAVEGWEYLRSDTLPNEERTGLTSFQTTFRSILVFRRPLAQTATQSAPQSAPNTAAPEATHTPPPAAPAETPFMPQVVTGTAPHEEESEADMDNVLSIALLQRAQQVGEEAQDTALTAQTSQTNKKSEVAAE